MNTLVKAADYIDRLPYWKHLSQGEMDYLKSNTSLKSYDKGNIIHGPANSCLGMVYIITGAVRVYLLSEEGREVTLFRLEAGDCCVLSSSCVISQITFDTQMAAETDCDFLVVNSGAFGRLSDENIYVKCFMYELAAERFSSVMWSIQQILFQRFDRRLSAFLLDEYDRTGRNEIRITHEQIAQQISSAREVVTRMLKRFVSDGLVEMKRGMVILKDIEGLRSL